MRLCKGGKLLIVCFLSAFSPIVFSDDLDSNAALNEFKQRTFLSSNDVVVLAGTIESVVGEYITESKNGFQLEGSHANTLGTAKKIELKDRQVYHKLFSAKSEVSLGAPGILNLGGGRNQLDELIISDVVSVTDSSIDIGSCTSNKPSAFGSDIKYWCIRGVTLSKIATNNYDKKRKLASGSYGVATASGTYQKDNLTTTSRLVANISVIGPFKGSTRVVELILPKPDTETGFILKSFPDYESTQLEGKVVIAK